MVKRCYILAGEWWRTNCCRRNGFRATAVCSTYKGSSGADIKLKGDYSVEYANKLQSAYKKFKSKGFELSEHSLNRIQGRINQGKIGSIDDVMNVLEKGTKYTDTVNGGTVIFKDNISVHIAGDGTIKTVIGNAKVKSTWEVYK